MKRIIATLIAFAWAQVGLAQPTAFDFKTSTYLDSEELVRSIYAPNSIWNLYGLLDDTQIEIGWPRIYISDERPMDMGIMVTRLVGRRWCDGDDCTLIILVQEDEEWVELLKTKGLPCLSRAHQQKGDELGYAPVWFVGRTNGVAGFRYSRGEYISQFFPTERRPCSGSETWPNQAVRKRIDGSLGNPN